MVMQSIRVSVWALATGGRLSCGLDCRGAVQSVQVPRFPVGRIQLNDHQRSAFDTPMSIAEKFNEAADEKTCIQKFITRRIQQLRKNPPQPQKLEEIRRMLLAMEDPSETWPKVCPTTFYLDSFSSLLKKHGHAPLNLPERMVLSGVPKGSQWDALRVRQIPLMHVTTQETTLMEAHYEADKERLTQRLLNLKRKANRTYFIPSAPAYLFPRTSANLAEQLLDTAAAAGMDTSISPLNRGEATPPEDTAEHFIPLFPEETPTDDYHMTMQKQAKEEEGSTDAEEEEEEEAAFYMDAYVPNEEEEQEEEAYGRGGQYTAAACEQRRRRAADCLELLAYEDEDATTRRLYDGDGPCDYYHHHEDDGHAQYVDADAEKGYMMEQCLYNTYE
jgi:hypothetical protein